MSKLTAVFLVAFGFAYVTPVRADISFKYYQETEKTGGPGWLLLKSYFGGVGTGYAVANIALAAANQAPLYCPPQHMALVQDNYLAILDKTLTNKLLQDDSSKLEYVLLVGLQNTFPCK